MKAVICTGYGKAEVLQLQTIEKPTPKKDELLIKIRSTAVTSADSRIRAANPFLVRLIFGLTKPRNDILGGNLAGEVEAIGESVTKFKVGDKIYGSSGMKFGAYAEYTTLAEDAVIAKIPAKMSYDQAAAIIFGGLTAISFLKKARIKQGQKVLIYGASGAVGTAAIQIAKHYGATVTAVCRKQNFTLVKSLGADKAIDYTTTTMEEYGEQYDVFYETVGKTSIAQGKKLLNKNGIYIAGASGILKGYTQTLWSMIGNKKVISGVASETTENLKLLSTLFEKGKFTAVIDKTYPLNQIVEAHKYVETGRKKGNVVIKVG